MPPMPGHRGGGTDYRRPSMATPSTSLTKLRNCHWGQENG